MPDMRGARFWCLFLSLYTVGPNSSNAEELYQRVQRWVQSEFQLKDIETLGQQKAGSDPEAFERAKRQLNLAYALHEEHGDKRGVAIVNDSVNDRAKTAFGNLLDHRAEQEKIWTIGLRGRSEDMAALEERSANLVRQSAQSVAEAKAKKYEDKVSWRVLEEATRATVAALKATDSAVRNIAAKVEMLIDLADNTGTQTQSAQYDPPWKCIQGRNYWEGGCFNGDAPPKFEVYDSQGPSYEDLMNQNNQSYNNNQFNNFQPKQPTPFYACPNPPC